MNELQGFEKLMEIMRRLRAPGGCPWDAEQSHESLKRYLLEEAYEVIESSQAQVANWEKIKQTEKGTQRVSALSGVPPQLPALMRAHKITEKAARVGFDWEHTDQVFAKVMEELHEFEEARLAGDQKEMEAELGDLLFAIVNLGRFLAIDPEDALRKTIQRFTKRFSHVEDALHARGQVMESSTPAEMDLLWEEAKKLERE